MLTAKEIIRNEIAYLRAARKDYSDEHWTDCILADLAAAGMTVQSSSRIKALGAALLDLLHNVEPLENENLPLCIAVRRARAFSSSEGTSKDERR